MKRSSILLFGSVGYFLFVAACVFFVPRENPVVPGREGIFPHAVHVGDDVGLDCVECHDTVETEAFAGMPTLDLCTVCHDEETDVDYPAYSQLASFILPGNKSATWSSVTSSSVDLSYSHAMHSDAKVDCESCHVGVSDSMQTSWGWAVSMDACTSCHEMSAVGPLDCEECHEGLGPDVCPDNHDNDWDYVHGMLSSVDNLHSPVAAMNCELCHSEETCDSCHRTTEPRNHTEPWRARGHGFSAAINRDSCATCHTEASCVACHQTSTPTNHVGIWGGQTSAHCVSCHIPLDEGDNCSVCHQSTPSHNLAPIRLGPPHPGPSSDCLSCHAPLNHMDNGQDCANCHH